MHTKLTPEQRFWSKVDPCRTDGCAVWLGSLDKEGYGRFTLPDRTKILAYHFLGGKVPEGLQWDHLCRNRACVWPEHLEAVPRLVNMMRGSLPEKRRQMNAAITHCPQGHEYTTETTYVYGPRKSRQCRLCHNSRERERKRRQKVPQYSVRVWV